ncbi:MAG: hypothetical protein Q4B73_08960, partial [Lachnospiraceae bacterium]|nr:hypothetical protein [Lachnospiraceae bacterium]
NPSVWREVRFPEGKQDQEKSGKPIVWREVRFPEGKLEWGTSGKSGAYEADRRHIRLDIYPMGVYSLAVKDTPIGYRLNSIPLKAAAGAGQ